MSDYSGPYGTDHDPSEMRTGADRSQREKRERERPSGEDRAAETRRERPGDEGEGEASGEKGGHQGAGGAAVTETPD